jgi:hypothetical protein
MLTALMQRTPSTYREIEVLLTIFGLYYVESLVSLHRTNTRPALMNQIFCCFDERRQSSKALFLSLRFQVSPPMVLKGAIQVIAL